MPTVPRSKRPPWLPERKPHEGRKRPNAKEYNSTAWRNLASKHKRLNPLCVQCLAMGRITPVEVTDHLNPINQGGSLLDWDNLQSLCHPCHNAKSGREAHPPPGV